MLYKAFVKDKVTEIIKSSKQIKSSKNDSGRYKIYYNTNKSAASRGFAPDDDSEEKLFNSIDEIATWMRDEGVGYLLCDDDGNLLPDLTLDDLVKAANDADLSGGDPAIFSFEDSDTGEVKYTYWDPEDFEFDDDWDDEDDDDDIYSSRKVIKSSDLKVDPVSPVHPIPEKLPKKEEKLKTAKKKLTDKNGKTFEDYLNEEAVKSGYDRNHEAIDKLFNARRPLNEGYNHWGDMRYVSDCCSGCGSDVNVDTLEHFF